MNQTQIRAGYNKCKKETLSRSWSGSGGWTTSWSGGENQIWDNSMSNDKRRRRYISTSQIDITKIYSPSYKLVVL